MVGAELLQSGQLAAALERVAGEVRSRPADVAARTFYFELLCFAGDLDRAAKQLDVIAMANADIAIGATTYHSAIAAEKQRRAFFHGGAPPQIIEPVAYADAYIRAVQRQATGESELAATLLSDAVANVPAVEATINGVHASDLQDASDLLAPFLEVVMDGRYAWIAFESIQSLKIAPPKYLRDTIWTPATVTLTSGSHGEVFVFALYPDSHLHADEQVRLGRTTVWEPNEAGFNVAYGQKVLTAGDVEHSLLEIRDLEVVPCPSHA